MNSSTNKFENVPVLMSDWASLSNRKRKDSGGTKRKAIAFSKKGIATNENTKCKF